MAIKIKDVRKKFHVDLNDFVAKCYNSYRSNQTNNQTK